MKKLLSSFIFSTKAVYAILFSLIALVFYTFVAYIIAGHEIISGGALGSDAWSFISLMKLLSEYFPKYPFWNYIQGGGISLTQSYPILVHTIIIATSKISGITLVEAFKFWEFAYVPIFAFGIFIFAWVRFKISFLAFLAGLFFIVSPIAWMWPFEWGFIAEAIAAMFFPYTVLFFDLFLLDVLELRWSLRTRIYLLFTVLFSGLSLLAHPFVFTGSMGFLLVYGFLVALLRKEKIIRSLIYYLLSIGGIFTLTVLVFGFWIIPFYDYTNLANSYSTRASASGPPKITVDWERTDLTFTHVFSIDPPRILSSEEYFKEYPKLQDGDYLDEPHVREKGYIWRNLSFPLGISILYFLSIPVSIILWRKKLTHLLVASFFLAIVSVNIPVSFVINTIDYYLAKIPFIGFPAALMLGWIAGWRSNLFALRLMVPIGAAFSFYGVYMLLFYPLKFLDKYTFLKFIKGIIIGVLAVGSIGLVIYYYSSKPLFSYPYLSFGKEVSISGRAFSLDDIWYQRREAICDPSSTVKHKMCVDPVLNKYFYATTIIRNLDYCRQKNNFGICDGTFTDDDVINWNKLCLSGKADKDIFEVICTARKGYDFTWDKLKRKLSEFKQNQFYLGEGAWQDVLSMIPDDPFVRYDTSPNFVALSQMGPYLKNTPQMTVYIATSSLIERLWGYQLSSFYTSDQVYSDKYAIPQIAQYLGIKYIVSGGEKPEVVEKLHGGEFFKPVGNQVYELEGGEPLVAVAQKPSILVIGSERGRAYETVFKRAPYGLISYDKAMLVKGGETVDQYSLSDLRNFEMVILYGYKYKNKSRATKLLDQYIKEGGRVFIDTGWQYESADWNVGDTPSFIAPTKLKWTNFGKTPEYKLHDGLVDLSNIEVASFQPLVWGNDPWGVSSGNNLKSWAKPILSVKGNYLLAGGNYGKGKVVWSGMNSLAHLGKQFKSDDPETAFLSKVFDWLLEGYQVKNYVFRKDFSGRRVNPDRVEFTFNTQISDKTYLYFKEAAHPFWSAVFSNKEGQKNLSIHRAGPGFIYINMPKVSAGDKLIISIKKPVKYALITLVSILTFVGLLINILTPRLFNPRPLLKLIKKMGFFRKRNLDVDEENNY